MITIYGSELCPDCRDCRRNFDFYNIPYTFIDINKELAALAAFLKLRDTEPVFAKCKQIGDIGLPALVLKDGTITLDWEDIVRKQGHEPVRTEASCSIDHEGC